MYKGKKVSVAISTYNEKDSIRKSIEDFFLTGVVDEVVVVDNNAAVGTADEVRKTKARLVFEPRQGYGYGFQRALAESTGDLLVMCEPDGTFLASDIEKLLVYSDCMDVVQGTRTNGTTILDDANMGLFLKYGNYFVAKLAEFAFWKTAPNLSDCGCTYRMFTREAYEQIKPYFRESKSAFGFELTLLTLRCALKMCQIPVHYCKRVGRSSVTGSFRKTLVLGMAMIGLILRHRCREWFHPLKGNFHS